MSKDLNTIFNNFQKWLDKTNVRLHPVMDTCKGYMPFDEQLHVFREGQREMSNGGWIPYPIQQVELEIRDFVDLLLKNNKTKSILEIGLGNFGGTHMLWKEIFDDVISIDLDENLYNKFINNNILDENSHVVFGDSQSEEIYNSLPIKQFDALFLDGDHSTEGVHKDFLIYEPMVRKGGIIGFHDGGSPKWGVQRFLHLLQEGKVNGRNYNIGLIQHSIEVGIAYIYV